MKKKIKIYKTKIFVRTTIKKTLISDPKLFNEPLIKLEKQKLIEFISKVKKENITKIRQILLLKKLRFGNQLIIISKVIFFCHILGCKRVILNNNWFIKNKFINKKLKIIIEPRKIKKIKDVKFDTLIDNTPNFFYYKNLINKERNNQKPYKSFNRFK